MTIEGCDIAEYQPDWTPDPDEDFVIIKATLGMTVTDPKRARHADVARDAGLVVGFYHFGWPSTHSGTGAEQADFFLANIPDLRPGELLVYDWEPSNDGEPSVKDRDSFLNRLRDRAPDHRIGLYANPSNFRADPCPDWVFAWPAWWTTSTSDPDLDGKDWTVWQYSDSPYDQDRANFPTREAMREWAGAGDGDGPLPFGFTQLASFTYTGVNV